MSESAKQSVCDKSQDKYKYAVAVVTVIFCILCFGPLLYSGKFQPLNGVLLLASLVGMVKIVYSVQGNKEGYNLFSYGAVPQTYENPEENLKEYKNYSFYSELLNTKIDSHKVINSDNKTFLKELLQKKKIIKSNKLNPNN